MHFLRLTYRNGSSALINIANIGTIDESSDGSTSIYMGSSGDPLNFAESYASVEQFLMDSGFATIGYGKVETYGE